jgi:hypothetical protein
MPPGGKRGSIAVVFVACVVVELEPPVAVAALLPLVAAVDCTAEDGLAVALGEDDWESDATACQLGNPSFWVLVRTTALGVLSP